MGLVLWRHEQAESESIVRFAQRAEDAGLAALWIPETWVRDASVQLAVAALSTQKIRLASGIFNIFSRSPGQLAQTASELDMISGGRFTLGVGVSGRAVIENWHARPFDRPLLRTRETIAVLRSAFSGGRVDFAGETIRMKGFRLRRRPLQETLPIFLAANGPANTRLCGEVADGWIPFFLPFSRFKESLAILAEGASGAGRSLSEIEVAPFIMVSPNDDLGRARAAVKSVVAFYIGAMGDYYHAQISRWGYAEEADRIRAAWRKGGRAAAVRTVSDHLVDDLALCGPISRCMEGLSRLREEGVTHPILRFPDEMEEEEVSRALEALGRLSR